jgi:dihydroorotase
MERRAFLRRATAGGFAAGAMRGESNAAPASARDFRQEVRLQPKGKYDILLKGGQVIDPANGVNEVRDVAVADGHIALTGRDIPATEAKRTVDVSGLYVSPGFIDVHVHAFYTYQRDNGVRAFIIADDVCFKSGVTTCVDAGSAGGDNFDELKKIIDSSRVRTLAFLNIARGGMRDSSEQDPRQYDIQLAVDTAKRFPKEIVGFKIAHYWTYPKPYDDLHTPWANVDAVTAAGRKADLPCMFDWSPRPAEGKYPLRSYRELILEKSRPGDIHTHHYARQFPVLDQNGRVNPDVFKAQERGFIFDCGHGAGSFVWRNAVPAIEQGFISNSISTDLYRLNTNGPVLSMIHVMSKYLCLGVPLEQVVRMSTVNPAREINRSELGTLSIGSPADIAVFEQQEGHFSYRDTRGAKHEGIRRLAAVLTISGGTIVFDPFALSYPLWEHIPNTEDYWVNQSGQFF